MKVINKYPWKMEGKNKGLHRLGFVKGERGPQSIKLMLSTQPEFQIGESN
jgi:hypothetical protein